MTPPAATAPQSRKGSALVVYATTEGHTAKIGHFVADLIARCGLKVDLYNAADLPKRFTAAGYDRIVVAASLHAGRHQRAIETFVRKHAGVLDRTHAMFLSVSLSAGGEKHERKEALSLAWKFVGETGWKPTVVLSVAGALRFSQYDFFRRWIMTRIARDHGLTPDPGKDMEFTDWAALETAVGKFIGSL
jgi:menaquinone-dependent protoporphyrinogen oxidase